MDLFTAYILIAITADGVLRHSVGVNMAVRKGTSFILHSCLQYIKIRSSSKEYTQLQPVQFLIIKGFPHTTLSFRIMKHPDSFLTIM